MRDLRRHNRVLVLELVRTRGPVSRAELARTTGLSIPAVMEIVEQLMGEGLVREVGVGPSTGGRRPVLLEMISEAYSAVGVEVGPRDLSVVVTDLRANIRWRSHLPSRMPEGPEALMGQLRAALGETFGGAADGAGQPLGIGIALPAPIFASRGAAFSPTSYPGWGSLRLSEKVAEEFGLPVLVDNDANAAALGEHLFGAGRGVRDMFYVVAHQGIGGAGILDGRLYRGADGGAGELGHTLVDLDGPRCPCGRYGCLEAFASHDAIARRARRALKLAGGKRLAGLDPEAVSAEAVIEAAGKGDAIAVEVVEETGKYLGIGISNTVNLLNPELVVMGGSTMRAGNLILTPVAEVVRRRALEGSGDRVRLVAAELGEDAAAVGAAALVLQELFATSSPLAANGGDVASA